MKIYTRVRVSKAVAKRLSADESAFVWTWSGLSDAEPFKSATALCMKFGSEESTLGAMKSFGQYVETFILNFGHLWRILQITWWRVNYLLIYILSNVFSFILNFKFQFRSPCSTVIGCQQRSINLSDVIYTIMSTKCAAKMTNQTHVQPSSFVLCQEWRKLHTRQARHFQNTFRTVNLLPL